MMRFTSSVLVGLAVSAASFAQRYTSPPANVSAVIAGDHITIDYYAPSTHGRKIIGSLVPYGVVWCTGANWATKITTETDLDMNGLKLPRALQHLDASGREGMAAGHQQANRAVPPELRSEPGPC